MSPTSHEHSSLQRSNVTQCFYVPTVFNRGRQSCSYINSDIILFIIVSRFPLLAYISLVPKLENYFIPYRELGGWCLDVCILYRSRSTLLGMMPYLLRLAQRSSLIPILKDTSEIYPPLLSQILRRKTGIRLITLNLEQDATT